MRAVDARCRHGERESKARKERLYNFGGMRQPIWALAGCSFGMTNPSCKFCELIDVCCTGARVDDHGTMLGFCVS